MKLELVVSAQCPECQQAAAIWRRCASEQSVPFTVCDIESPAGKAIRIDLALQTVPAILIDGKLKGIGVQSADQAEQMIMTARASSPPAASNKV